MHKYTQVKVDLKMLNRTDESEAERDTSGISRPIPPSINEKSEQTELAKLTW